MEVLTCTTPIQGKEEGKIRILVISDSHGDPRSIRSAVEAAGPIDALIHCGDIEGDLHRSLPEPPAYGIYLVRGNCDRSGSPDKIVVKAGYLTLLILHGHRCPDLLYGSEGLLREARKAMADVVLYGHIHVPSIEEEDGVLMLNPGSVSRPRQSPRIPTYAILTIYENAIPEAQIFPLED